MMNTITPEDQLFDAIIHFEPHVSLKKCTVSFEKILTKAIMKDVRILAIYEGCEGKSVPNRFSRDYEIDLKYSENCPQDLDSIYLDNSTWSIDQIKEDDFLNGIYVITNDVEKFEKSFNENFETLVTKFEGVTGCTYSSKYSMSSTFKQSVVNIKFVFVTDAAAIKQRISEAQYQAKVIWKKILGTASVPACVKPFLALSYLMQECTYDQKAYDDDSAASGKQPPDPIPYLSYGPLVKSRGICGGLAWAFKRLMDEQGVECKIVFGHLSDSPNIGHAWNLVKIDGLWYHVDCTWGISQNGVCVKGLMKDDKYMMQNHLWNKQFYPSAIGKHYQYSFIEDILAEHGNEYLAEGASEKYMFPSDIFE